MSMNGRFGAEQRVGPDAQISLITAPARKTVPSLANAIREVNPDLLVTYNWGAIESTAAAWLYSLCPTIHTEDGFGVDEAHGPKLRRALARRIVLNRIHMTVVPSQTLHHIALNKYAVAASKVKFIANGVDTDRFQPRRDHTVRVGGEALVFGFVGLLRAEKNLAFLLRAFAGTAIAGARLMLVGDGPCRAELESLARELAVSDRVIFIGNVEDTSRYYSLFDVFVMSSATEQMPLSLLEAMACGLPAVCTDAGDTAAILGEPAVPRGDLNAYTDALRRMAANSEIRATQGARNRSRAVDMYSQSRMVSEYEAVYRGALTATMD